MDKDDLRMVECFSELVTQHGGRYVTVMNETLVKVGDSRHEVATGVRKIEPNKIPSVLRVPSEVACLS